MSRDFKDKMGNKLATLWLSTGKPVPCQIERYSNCGRYVGVRRLDRKEGVVYVKLDDVGPLLYPPPGGTLDTWKTLFEQVSSMDPEEFMVEIDRWRREETLAQNLFWFGVLPGWRFLVFSLQHRLFNERKWKSVFSHKTPPSGVRYNVDGILGLGEDGQAKQDRVSKCSERGNNRTL